MERVNITIGPLSFDHADYDTENDAAQPHVGEPQVGEGEETPEGHVVRYSAPGTSRIVGLTVLGARHTSLAARRAPHCARDGSTAPPTLSRLRTLRSDAPD